MLGHSPLCEASAAVWVPFGPDLVLVADDDVEGALFAFESDRYGRLRGQRVLALPGPDHPEDIEGLAAAGERLVVVGSHGRNGRCERVPGRERMQVLTWRPGSTRLDPVELVDSGPLWEEIAASPEACLEHLFVHPAPERAEAVCAAIVEAERSARRGACMPLDVEGAAGVSDEGGDRIWLGLRRPRVEGRPVLLRLTPGLAELRFDAVALLAVEDRGVRALSSHDGWLWAVLGPAAPDFDRSVLWRAPVERLRGSVTVIGEVVRDDLPPACEGLVVDDRGVTLVIDGDEGATTSGRCRASSHQLRITY